MSLPRFAAPAAGFVLALATLALIVRTAYVSMLRAEERARWAAQSVQVREGLARLISLLYAAESGLRAYALTGEEQYWTAVADVGTAFDRELAGLEQGTRDSPEQQRSLRQLGGLIQARLERMQATAEARRTEGRVDEDTAEGTHEGQTQTAAIRELVGRMLAEEGRRLDERYQAADRSAADTRRWILGGGLASALLIGLAVLGFGLEARERDRAEAQLRAQRGELERTNLELRAANEELEAFTYTVSHDLRAPIRHIAGFVGLLGRHLGDGLDDKGRRYLSLVDQAAVQMGRLIDDLLELSRTGRAALRRERVALDAIVREARSLIEAEAAGRTLEWRITPLPEVTGDRALLRVVFVNLLSNAVKYTRGREPAVIEVGPAEERNGHAVVCVKDNGTGFDMKYAHKLFGVFQRLHRSEDFEGTGIGLATVRRVVHRHGGAVWAEAAPDRGAAFYVALPREGA